MTRTECKERINEMLPDVLKFLDGETDRLIGCGGIDLESKDTETYGAAKSILIVALENAAKQYFHKSFKKIVANLRHY